MLVYGDPKRRESADSLCEAIAERLWAIEHQPPGLDRHSALVGILLSAGELVQGLSDLEFEALRADETSARREDSGVLLLELARLVATSWSQSFSGPLALPRRVWALLQELRAPLPLSIKEAEGYAFYALYPEAYMEAARHSGLGAKTVVIGIRSIGISLSAAVATAIRARSPVTVRPVGHPFRRTIEVGARLSRQLLKDTTADFAIADEGPGLSGSSFGGVADWLLEHGVSEDRIHFFPGHRGELGPQASQAHRERWASRPRHVVEMDELMFGAASPVHRLATWVSGLVGPLLEPLRDVSGGAWRHALCGDHQAWPPADPRFERRKFLAHTADGAWLVKFAGLGQAGERKLAKARLLAENGFTPPVAGLCHGFLVQKWVPARPMASGEFRRAVFIDHLGRYLGFRARHLPPPATGGASLSELSEMALVNTEEALGAAVASRLKERLAGAPDYDRVVRPVDTDNRLHSWEWLVTGAQRFIKTDALDHSAAHDLIGCQDVAWDIAGACVEFEFSKQEAADLSAAVSRESCRAVPAELQAMFEICYLAFQLGLWSSAKPAAAADEVPRLEAAASRYATRLSTRIDGDGS
ncbi:hypothetical protein M728_004618 (plasmid) [Ensifer sp. WSM1721]|uniref:hypothetical protein n=1 Tax=Ensifer sp. WSM1721 TaxID=1041159 RepID=UPI000478CA5C|nr:hypothetical protein [Ensifer sp. WSM1721]